MGKFKATQSFDPSLLGRLILSSLVFSSSSRFGSSRGVNRCRLRRDIFHSILKPIRGRLPSPPSPQGGFTATVMAQRPSPDPLSPGVGHSVFLKEGLRLLPSPSYSHEGGVLFPRKFATIISAFLKSTRALPALYRLLLNSARHCRDLRRLVRAD